MTEPAEIHPFPGPPGLFAQEQPHQPEPKDGLGLLAAVAAILNARILALIALLGSVGVWVWAAYDPSTLRLYTGFGISFGVLVPCLWFAHRKG